METVIFSIKRITSPTPPEACSHIPQGVGVVMIVVIDILVEGLVAMY